MHYSAQSGRQVLAFFSTILGAIFAPEVAVGVDFQFRTVGSGFSLPSDVVQAPGDPGRLFVTELFAVGGGGGMVGRISTLDLATSARSTFLELPGVETLGEGGVHSIAFHPDYQQSNGKFYVAWLKDVPSFFGGPQPASRVDEYQVIDDNPVFSRTILELQQATTSPFHGIAKIAFDPTAVGTDRDLLYIGMGDGGPQADSPSFTNRPQNLNSLYGKILRVGVGGGDDLPGDLSRNYTIPGNNPFANDGNPATTGEIWHSGLRNPWRFSFDSATGDMYIGDVGFFTREEISFAVAGESGIDFGWGQREGSLPTQGANWPGFTGAKGASRDPIFDQNHGSDFASIVGGVLYRGPIQSLQGKYIFADSRVGRIYAFDFDPNIAPANFNGQNITDFLELTDQAKSDLGLPFLSFGGVTADSIVSLGQDSDGNLYLSNLSRGEIYLLSASRTGDLNDDGIIDEEDWEMFRAGQFIDMTGFTPQQAYEHGDLNGDFVNDDKDFRIFAAIYRQYQNSEGALATSTVPEPSSLLLIAVFSMVLGWKPKCGSALELSVERNL